jgi:hypothetical protein
LYHGGKHGRSTCERHNFRIRAAVDVIFALLERSYILEYVIFPQSRFRKKKKCRLMPQNGSGRFHMVFWNQFSKLGPTAKMYLQANSSNFFHPESTKIDEKIYNDPIHIIPPHLGRILVLKIFT